MNILKSILLSFIFIVSPVYASTDDIMLGMIEWIEKNSKYRYNGEELPIIELRPAEEICEILFESPSENCNALGYYDHDQNIIVLSPTPNEYMVEEKYIEVVIFHELVHFLQYLNGEDEIVKCQNALEKDAYILQDKFIEEMGWPEGNRPDMFFAFIISQCDLK